jgi:hypothetical protein
MDFGGVESRGWAFEVRAFLAAVVGVLAAVEARPRFFFGGGSRAPPLACSSWNWAKT